MAGLERESLQKCRHRVYTKWRGQFLSAHAVDILLTPPSSQGSYSTDLFKLEATNPSIRIQCRDSEKTAKEKLAGVSLGTQENLSHRSCMAGAIGHGFGTLLFCFFAFPNPIEYHFSDYPNRTLLSMTVKPFCCFAGTEQSTYKMLDYGVRSILNWPPYSPCLSVGRLCSCAFDLSEMVKKNSL
ncbi:uncharacterized protein LOC126410284 [Nymphaea colorata]|uniref:uncharacterized protein LOC126410284 n=1 Tax=Nymphaea colorata TaxID=210225 RepID=UPI00214EBD2E|nr:uncharacterized protein LOC126410284 [Nymphaea colorata]